MMDLDGGQSEPGLFLDTVSWLLPIRAYTDPLAQPDESTFRRQARSKLQ